MMLDESVNVMCVLIVIEWIGLDAIEVEDDVLMTLEPLLLLKMLEFHLLLKRIEFLLHLLPLWIKASCLHWSPT